MSLNHRALRGAIGAELQARMNLHDQQPAQAVDDMLAAMALARNIGLQKLLVSSLVEIGIEMPAIDRFALMMAVLPKEVRATLPDKLAALPTPATGKELMDAEFEYAKIASAKLNHVPPEIFEAAKPFYQHVGDAMTQPTRSVSSKPSTSEVEQVLMLNPFVKIDQSGDQAIRSRSLLAMDVKRVMLQHRQSQFPVKGPDAVKDSKDPAGDGPFEYAVTPRVLRS